MAFFALDRAGPGLLGVFEEKAAAGGIRLRALAASQTAPARASPLFYVLPADAKNPPAASVPLFEFVHEDGRRACGVDEALSSQGYTRSKEPIGRVWHCPTGLKWQVKPR